MARYWPRTGMFTWSMFYDVIRKKSPYKMIMEILIAILKMRLMLNTLACQIFCPDWFRVGFVESEITIYNKILSIESEGAQDSISIFPVPYVQLMPYMYEIYRVPINMPLCASAGPVLVRCWKHRPSTDPALAHYVMFMGYP